MMAASEYLRLRQVCLVAHQLDPVVDDLCTIFDAAVCYRDPVVTQFGLQNALIPIGTSFIEVVAPITENTAAARYLERRAGDGGYMTIFDSDALPKWRRHLAEIGVRIAMPLVVGDYEGIQLHPRDTGGTMLEISHTLGGEALEGPYGPAGPKWRGADQLRPEQGILGAAIQSQDPQSLASRWARILRRSSTLMGGEFYVHVDNATLRFVARHGWAWRRAGGSGATSLRLRRDPSACGGKRPCDRGQHPSGRGGTLHADGMSQSTAERDRR
ncbi:MAG: VOC family protein [Acetobacteraceae bacterium]